ncbi:acylamino-acid-releasing enzyme, putative [Eimeria necatrix]|uniref:Acylamino-acid-releasing enzyme, putative n=1 Tax=Eimeria necatrix TaxID=51315 RepID=U6MUH3_9EIME|nr:acylamino-acid-releasing enzyme, putative [Eimeria necatrix]CDJ66733.1 acylamino-acid-releasing enzyme, putative [Eimeria necatrix]
MPQRKRHGKQHHQQQQQQERQQQQQQQQQHERQQQHQQQQHQQLRQDVERQQLREVRKNESRPQHKGEDRHAHLQHQQEDGRQQPSPKDTGLADAANGLAEEVHRRLRVCSANAIDVASAQMYGEGPDGCPTFVRCSGSQRVVDKKRRLLISWAPTTQLPPTAIPVDSQPALEFYSPSGQFVAQVTSVPPPENKGVSSGGGTSAAPLHRLEVWGAAGTGDLGCAMCLFAPHGIPWLSPYGGGCFCSQDENLLLYVAETPQKDACPPLDNYLYKDTWGEQLLQHSRGRVVVGSITPPTLVPLQPRQRSASYAQASFVPDGSAVVCTEIPSEPYRLGLKFCINRRSAVFLADFPTGGVARALRALGASDKVPQGPLQPTWLRISDEEDWAAWEARICDLPSHPPGPLLAFEVVYLALSDDSKEKRPHFGNARLRVAIVARENPESPWVVKSRKTLVSPSPSSSFQSRHGKSSEASNGEFAPTTVQSVCVAGPQKESSSVAAAHSLKAFEGLCCTQLPPWRSRGFLVMNTFRGCRQTVVAIPTGLQAGEARVKRVQFEGAHGPKAPADVKAAVAAATVGDVLLRDIRGPWLLIQTSSPVHAPILAIAKLRELSFNEEEGSDGDSLGPPHVAEVVDAVSLRGGSQGAFNGAVKKLQLHMLTLSLYHLDHQRHWLVRLGRPPKGPEEPSLAVLIHGGPHSCASCMYNRDVLFLTTLGFDVLVVNYRGSAGFGQDELVSLHGRAGRQDVEDVAQIVQQVINKFGYDSKRCAAVGGSHGGFLCCHLIGQFPKLFSAASTRNPVTYVPGMYTASDIPDFVFPVSCGEDFDFAKMPSAEALVKMQRLSPTEFVGTVQTPLLLALGAKDQRNKEAHLKTVVEGTDRCSMKHTRTVSNFKCRTWSQAPTLLVSMFSTKHVVEPLEVPPSQGLLFWRLLSAHGKKNKLLWYPEDNHSLDLPVTDADYWANTGAWFLEHVPQPVLPPV